VQVCACGATTNSFESATLTTVNFHMLQFSLVKRLFVFISNTSKVSSLLVMTIIRCSYQLKYLEGTAISLVRVGGCSIKATEKANLSFFKYCHVSLEEEQDLLLSLYHSTRTY